MPCVVRSAGYLARSTRGAGNPPLVSSYIVTLDVIERDDGIAVDDLCVETPDLGTDALRYAAEAVPAAVVEAIRPLSDRPEGRSPMALAAVLADAEPDDALEQLVRGVPGAMWASWCVALKAGAPPHVLAASPSAPSMSNVSTPWLPLERPRRFDPSMWMPPAWCMGKMSYELAAIPLARSDEALLVARKHGPRFRRTELRDLGFLAEIALSSRRFLASAALGT